MKVSDHIHALRLPFKITTPAGNIDRFVYSFVVFGEDIYLIDTGVSSSYPMIFDYINKMGRKPEEIAAIILTHSHPDHLGSAKSIKELTGCRVMAHYAEKDWIENIDRQFAERPVPGFYGLVAGSVPVDQLLNEGDSIDLGDDLVMKVMHTPGHSHGSISLYLENDKTMITGDVIPIPGDMPIYDDPLVLIESLRKLREIAEVRVLLSSWDEPQSGDSISTVIENGIKYIDNIHNSVIDVAKACPSIEITDLCSGVLKKLELPQYMANPLVARSFASSLRYL